MESGLVVGGIGIPKFYLLGEERNSDSFFKDSSLNTVSSSQGGASYTLFSRFLSSNSLYNDYVVRFSSHPSLESVLAIKFYEQESGNINTKIFSSLVLNSFDLEVQATLYVSDSLSVPGSGGKDIVIGLSPTPFYIDFDADFSGVTCLYLLLVVHSFHNIDVQMVSNRDVLSSIEFPAEQKYELEFIPEFLEKNYFLDGSSQKTVVGNRLKAKFNYDLLTLTEEEWRTYISEADCVAVVPRNDDEFHFFALWDGDYSRNYVENKFIGHSGVIPFVSIFLFQVKSVVTTSISGLKGYSYGFSTVLGEVEGTGTGSLISISEGYGGSNGVAEVIGFLSVKGFLIGVSDGIAEVIGDILGRGESIGNIDILFDTSGIIFGRSELIGIIDIYFDVIGVILSEGQLLSSINSYSEVSGILSRKLYLYGNSDILIDATGIILNPGQLLSSIDSFSLVSGTLNNRKILLGIINGVASVFGSLSWEGGVGNIGHAEAGQVTVWEDPTHIKGFSTFTYDGTNLFISGGISFGGDFALDSDARLKTKVKPCEPVKLEVNYKEFAYKTSPDLVHYGLIADDLKKTNPELVRKSKDGVLSFNPIDLLFREIVYLKSKVAELEAKMK